MATESLPSLRLTLMENAYDSLNESLHKVDLAEARPGQWKFALLHLVHAVELVLKKRLHDEHRLLLFENVDRPVKTISLQQALDRLQVIEVDVAASDVAAIRVAIKWRNSITHFETDLLLAEVRQNYLLLFEFLSSFHKSHLSSDLFEHLQDEHLPVASKLIEDFRSEFVDFRGQQMHRAWIWKLVASQEYPSVRLDGKEFERIRWGQEPLWRSESLAGELPPNYCHDCGATVGQLHGPGCDAEVCPRCGGQFTFCDCEFDADEFWGLFSDWNEDDSDERQSAPAESLTGSEHRHGR
ncbi:hypothetical protein [Agromyces aerolatus]|uniref:hypothetical protein n=1 Tax=Agromyces sp. LY-1074 TaxID=3074080 RepID=UPI00285D96BB|nr:MULTISPECIES: hypothetical protein [unclassified Agromyces]MDR5699959.1 hypothetical protein [Agromyces sp. LY-1074]MDR5706229.1 hypothetical protein [Agromyces sp. LY-1358]